MPANAKLQRSAASSAGSAEPQEALAHRLADRYARVRARTAAFAAHLEPEDLVVQSMADASPAKWHLAHTTWFFETFILAQYDPDYRTFDPRFGYLFNSYYEAAGPRHPRPHRGLITRPSADQVAAYRDHVDAAMGRLVNAIADRRDADVVSLLELGLNHEQQHQELFLTDLLHAFSCNPLRPAYRADLPSAADAPAAPATDWVAFPEGDHSIGHTGDGFAFDNEGPSHRVVLPAFRLATRAVTNGEWRSFIADGGYRRPTLWLSDGWATVQAEGWQAPLYWEDRDGAWWTFTLGGMQPVEDDAPVCHVSYFEADAFARWAGKRLPTEAEWEVSVGDLEVAGNFLESARLRPAPADGPPGALLQSYGDVWEWTSSPYVGYPGYRPAAGAVGEYNGKFMCSQFVLRGGSCVSAADHLRPTYRNFFYPHQRWQFSGLRLAEDAA